MFPIMLIIINDGDSQVSGFGIKTAVSAFDFMLCCRVLLIIKTNNIIETLVFYYIIYMYFK